MAQPVARMSSVSWSELTPVKANGSMVDVILGLTPAGDERIFTAEIATVGWGPRFLILIPGRVGGGIRPLPLTER
jgi:hypothetical protein